VQNILMGVCCPAEPGCEHEEALDVISEFVLIAGLPNEYIGNGNSNNEHVPTSFNDILLGITKYINTPLRQSLGYAKGAMPPPGKLDVVLKGDGKYNGTVILENSEQKRIYAMI
jgi:hypothetical protein